MNNIEKMDFQWFLIVMLKAISIILMATFIFLVSLVLSSCHEQSFIDTHTKYEIDSVDYHPIGSDHSMQTTPYWKCHLKGTKINVTSYYIKQKGDSIEVIERKLVKEEK